MKLDDHQVVNEARTFFREHGLLPPVPERFADDQHEAERVRLRILAQGGDAVPGTKAALGRGRAAPRPAARRRVAVAIALVGTLLLAGGAQALLRSAPAGASETPVMLTYSAGIPQSLSDAPAAREALAAAADTVAGAAPAAGQGPVQYLARYGWLANEQVGTDGTAAVVVYPTLTQWWLTPDGAVRVDESRGDPLDLRGRLAGNVTEVADRTTSETTTDTGLDPGLAGRLSTDPAALRAELLDTQAGLPCTQDARWQAECLLLAVQLMYDTYVVSPALASAMWTVLSGEADLRSFGTTVDRQGRSASTVFVLPEFETDPLSVMLFSDRTGAYLGTETIALHAPDLHIDRPTVVSFSVLSAARWVDAPGDVS